VLVAEQKKRRLVAVVWLQGDGMLTVLIAVVNKHLTSSLGRKGKGQNYQNENEFWSVFCYNRAVFGI